MEAIALYSASARWPGNSGLLLTSPRDDQKFSDHLCSQPSQHQSTLKALKMMMKIVELESPFQEILWLLLYTKKCDTQHPLPGFLHKRLTYYCIRDVWTSDGEISQASNQLPEWRWILYKISLIDFKVMPLFRRGVRGFCGKETCFLEKVHSILALGQDSTFLGSRHFNTKERFQTP